MDFTGKTGRTFGNRYKEHLRVPSPIHDHTSTMGHPIKVNNFSIKDRVSSSLNRNLGKCQLPHLWMGCCSPPTVIPPHPSHVPYGPHPTHIMGTHTHLIGEYGPPRGAFSPPLPSIMAPNFPAIIWHQKARYW